MDVISRHGLVIFDCDGVVADSDRLAELIGDRVLGSLGWNIRTRKSRAAAWGVRRTFSTEMSARASTSPQSGVWGSKDGMKRRSAPNSE